MSMKRWMRSVAVMILALSLVTTAIPVPAFGAGLPEGVPPAAAGMVPDADGKMVFNKTMATDDLLTLFGTSRDEVLGGPGLMGAGGPALVAWAGTGAELSTSECTYKPVQVTGFNADIIAEGSIFERDPFGSLSTQSQATTNMSLEPEGFAIQSTFVAEGFRGRADDDEAIPFDKTEAGEPSRMLAADGRLIYRMEGTGFSNTLFQLEPYNGPNAFAVKEGTTTSAEVNFVSAAGYQKLHLLTTGIPVQMNTFRIVFADGSSVTVDGGWDFGGSSHFESNGNHDGQSVSFVLAARNAFEDGNMEKTKATFNDTSGPITRKPDSSSPETTIINSDQMLDPQTDGLYYHYLTGRTIDLTNIAYTEEGVSSVGDLSGRPIKKLVFENPDFTAGEFVDYRAGFLLAVSGLASPTPAKPVWSADTNVSTYYFDLNWTDVSNESKYILEVATDNAFTAYVPGYQAKEYAANTTTAKVTGLEPNTTYYCRLTGYNNQLPGTASDVKTVTTAGEDGTYRVLYDLNGVTVLTPITDDKKYYNGDETEVLDGPSGTFIRNSDSAPVQFVSWNTQSDGGGEVYIAPASLLIGGGNTTLYAQWELAGEPDGAGTQAEPYILEDSGNLLWMSFKCRQLDWSRNKYFIQNNDIDLTGVNWIPIKDFGGHYDGGGFRIKNMTMRYDRAAADAAGMSTLYSQMIEYLADEQYRPDETNKFNYKNVFLNRYAFGMFETIDYFDDGGNGSYQGATLENIHLVGLTIDVDFNTADPNLYLEEMDGIPALKVPVVAAGGLVAAAGCGSIYELRISDWAKLSVRNCSIDATSSISVKAPSALVGGFLGYAYFKNDNYQRHQDGENQLVFTGNASDADILVESKSGLVTIKSPQGETSAYTSAADLTVPYKNVFEPTLTVGGLIGDLRINSAGTGSDHIANNCATGDVTVHSGSKVTARSLAYYNDNTDYTDPGIADTGVRKFYDSLVPYGLKRMDGRLMYAISGLTKVGGLFGSLDLEATTYGLGYPSGIPDPAPEPWPQNKALAVDFHSMYYAGTVTVDKGAAGTSSNRMMMAGSFIGAVRRNPMDTLDFFDDFNFPYANLENNFFMSGSTLNGQDVSPVGYSYQPVDTCNTGGQFDPFYHYPGSALFIQRFLYKYLDFVDNDPAADGYEDVAGQYETKEEAWLKDPASNNLFTLWDPAYWAFPEGQYPQLKQSWFNLDTVEIQTYDAGTTTSQAIAADPEHPGQRKLVMDPADSQDIILVETPSGEAYGSVKWTSDNPNVVTVASAMNDKFATLTSVNPGTATLTALTQKGGLVDTITVQVVGVDATGIAITYTNSEGQAQDEITLEVGTATTAGQLTAAVSPADAYNRDFRWESSDPDIVSVANDGVVTLNKYGQAFIYAFSEDGFLYDRIKVNAIPLVADTLSIDKTTIALNATYHSNPTEKITATASRIDGKPVSITKFKWQSSDDRVATVSQNGLVYAVGIGTATITVTTTDGSNLSKTCTVTVTGKHATGIAPRYAQDVNKELEAGEKVLLPVAVSPADALCKDVVWSSSNPDIVAVTPNGWVIPKVSAAIGDVTIMATTVDGGFTTSFQPKVTVGERKILVANKGRFFKMTRDKVRQMDTTVYPLDTDYPEVTYTSSNPAVATVSATGLVRTLSLGTTVITVKTNHKGLTESMVLNVVENSRATVVLKDKASNAAISGAVITIDGDTFTTGGDGSVVVTYAPDEPGTFFEIKKAGYRTKLFTLSEFSSGNLTVFMEQDDGTPYYKYIGKVTKAGLFGNLGEGYVSSSIKEVSTVHLWTDWKGTFEGDVFLSKGSKQFRGVPVIEGYYKLKERCFYEDTKGETGLFYANLYPAPTEAVPKPKAVTSRQITWEFIDFDKQYGEIGMSNSEVDFASTGQSDMFDTGFFMDLPEDCPVQIEVDGTDVKITIAYSTGMENGGEGGWSKTEDEPGGDVDEMEDDELLDSIKESIVSGGMSDKLKELTEPPTDSKLERRMEVSIELFGYVEGTLVQKPMFVDVASTDQAMAEKLGIDPAMMNALKNLGVPNIPLSIVSLEINSAGLQVTADGKVTYSQQFYPGGIPVYVELVIGAALEQILKFQILDDGGMDFEGSTQVKPYMGCYGALGIGKLLSIGPTLDGQLPITITYPDPVTFDISLAMQFGLRIKFLFWTKKFRFYDREWTLYNSSHRRAAPMRVQGVRALAEEDPKLEGFEPLPRDYAAYGYADDTAVNQLVSGVRNITDVRMTSGYPEIMPTLVCLEVDKQMLIWEDDDPARTLENRTVLVYSLSNDAGKSWSAPTVIDNDGKADGSYSVAVDDDHHVTIAFQSLARALTPADSLQDFTGLMQIKASVFDGAAFSAPVVVSNTTTPLAGDYTYEANVLPKAVVNGGEVSILWLTNTANDILGESGENVIRRVSYADGAFTKYETLYSTTSPIMDYSAAYHGGELEIAYLSDEDKNMATMTDRSIYLLDDTGNSSRVRVGAYLDNPVLARVNGKTALYWYEEKNIRYMPDMGITNDIRDVFAKANDYSSPATPDFRLVTKGEDSMLLYSVGSAVSYMDGDEEKTRPVKNIMAAFYDVDQQAWGGFSADLTQHDQDINHYSADLDANGDIHLAVSERIVTGDFSDAAKLKVFNIKPSVDLKVEDERIYYNESNMFEGATDLPIAAYVENKGQLAAKGVTLELYVSDALVASQEYPDAIIVPGEKAKRLTVDYPMPAPLSEEQVKLVVKTGAATDANAADNEASTYVGCGDLVLGKIKNTASDTTFVSSFKVVNYSCKALDNIVAKVYAADSDGRKTGEAVKTVAIGSLDAYQDKGASVEMELAAIDFAGASLKTYIIELSTADTHEVVTVNNTGYFSVLNPNRERIPFDVSVSRVIMDEDSLDFSVNAANLTASPNTGDLEIKVYAEPVDENTAPVLLRTVTKNALAVPAGQSVEEVVSVDNGDGSLDDAYMVTAKFTSGAGGMEREGVTYYSNLAFDTIAELIPSDNNDLSDLVLNGSSIGYSKALSDYRVPIAPDTKVKLKATAEDDISSLISYSLNDGAIAYAISGEETGELTVSPDDVLKLWVKAEDGSVRSYQVTFVPVPSGGGGGGLGMVLGTPTPVTVLVNGKTVQAAEKSVGTLNGQTLVVVTLNDEAIREKLEAEGKGSIVTVPVSEDAGIVRAGLNLQILDEMSQKEAVLEVVTDNVTYTLPANLIDVDALSKAVGNQVALEDIDVTISISTPSKEMIKVVEDSADKNRFQLVVPPVEFTITCTSGDKTVEVSKFNGYVERLIQIPEGVDPSKITTAVVINPDGTVTPVPTRIIMVDGKPYAQINSLTNSVYSVIWNPMTFSDVVGYGATGDAINDLGSRLIIGGIGNNKYAPERDITRAEFSVIIVKALGLKPVSGKSSFSDVAVNAGYAPYIQTAYEYGIISGYGNGRFGPDDKITREQAMTMIGNAMKITKLKVNFAPGEVDKLLSAYTDSGKIISWGRQSMAACIKGGIISGRGSMTLAPKVTITRAEVAIIVRKLLVKSGLI